MRWIDDLIVPAEIGWAVKTAHPRTLLADETNITPFPGRHIRFWAVEDREAIAGDLAGRLELSVSMAGGPAETIITIRTHDLEELDRLCRIIVAGSQAVKIER